MKVLFVSQCSKNAIDETRRIIDQFAERKGSFIWETNITAQGLEVVKRLLRSTARRNTAVACHLLRGRLQTELLWIVGNHRKFSREGNVPTNITARDILRADDENDWNTGEGIAILAYIAGLFHDFGKANFLFQNKLKGKSSKNFEPFRHEWISLLLFKEFVGSSSDDRDWLEKLSNISPEDEKRIIKNFPQEHRDRLRNPLKDMPQLAKFIGWLILSHHRLPSYYDKNNNEGEPQFENIDEWMDQSRFSALWNSPNCKDDCWKVSELKRVGSFPFGTPILSKSWCQSAKRGAFRALKHYSALNRDWFKDRFSMHLIRAVLMLSDHVYSYGDVEKTYQDPTYDVYANTDRKDGSLKQKLDEHNIGVAMKASMIAKRIPGLRDALPCISFAHKGFKKRNKDPKFFWQDQAYDLAYSIRDASHEKGFFGINLASTGCGKTLANARIMFGLSNENQGCRFNIALGLRVLTLQTGNALQEKLHLNSDELAVLIGSRAFQDLNELKNEMNGSESLDGLVDEEDYVHYEGQLGEEYVQRLFESSPKLQKMISAPVLVSTVDHLIRATEGCRGGKQIAPILRLLTSDLVLDEPDEFDVADLPSLCRLVNFAGVFGSKVLLSSATLPPSIVKALFEAYAAGRSIFNKACRGASRNSDVCCAWCDEYGTAFSEHADSESYMDSHSKFIDQRANNLEKQPVLRRASIASYESQPKGKEDAKRIMAETIRKSIYDLHDEHHQTDHSTGKNISIGLVRMANISPMVAVVKELLSKPAELGYCIHFCVYHARFPLLIRSKMEEVLDAALSRHDPEKIWENADIKSSLSGKSELNHIFVVFATAVAEVGRDHDYDWAVVEPSSMRSVIQLAGRVQRHRKISPSESNVIILQKNFKGLTEVNSAVVYTKPGFESSKFYLEDKDLLKSLHPSQYEKITAIPRLRFSEPLNFRENLSDLEHARLMAELFGEEQKWFHASMWWKHNADWCAEIQRHSKFRKSDGEYTDYIYYVSEENEAPKLSVWPRGYPDPIPKERFFEKGEFSPASGIYPWIECDVKKEIERISRIAGLSQKDVSLRFTTIRLKEPKDGSWINDPTFGFYEE